MAYMNKMLWFIECENYVSQCFKMCVSVSHLKVYIHRVNVNSHSCHRMSHSLHSFKTELSIHSLFSLYVNNCLFFKYRNKPSDCFGNFSCNQIVYHCNFICEYDNMLQKCQQSVHLIKRGSMASTNQKDVNMLWQHTTMIYGWKMGLYL